MSNFNEMSPIELQRYARDSQNLHDSLKKDIIELTKEVDNLNEKINKKLQQLKNVEENYVKVIEEIDKR